jgi:hypothetical protein
MHAASVQWIAARRNSNARTHMHIKSGNNQNDCRDTKLGALGGYTRFMFKKTFLDNNLKYNFDFLFKNIY